MAHYDAIIVGGRPAGSTLAARLAMQGLNVLLIERAKFPSLPGVSSPIIYSSTMTLLDEIGADEAAYARGTPRIERMINASTGLEFEIRIPMGYGRDYGYAVDRARFDAALWDHAASFPTVTARQGVSLIELVREGDRVTGAIIQADGQRETHSADVVIGADGRFSTVARKAGARELDTHSDYPTTNYYAYWKHVEPFDDRGAAAVAWGPGYGYGFLMMDSADGTCGVGVEGQSSLIDPGEQTAEQFYMNLIMQQPIAQRRLRNAERITDVRGMKRIGNLYRQAGGDGWALVGDAYHQKDPLDGQGMFDAVFTAKTLAAAIADWKTGRRPWAEAIAEYDRAARAETMPMYKSTMQRVRDALYTAPPSWLPPGALNFFGFLVSDPMIQGQIGRMITRQITADRAMSPVIVAGALMRAPLRGLSKFLEGEIAR